MCLQIRANFLICVTVLLHVQRLACVPVYQHSSRIPERKIDDESIQIVVPLLLLLLLPHGLRSTRRRLPQLCFQLAGVELLTTLPGFHGRLPFHLETGYVEVDRYATELFYYFIESEASSGGADEDPFLLWLTGGNRCSVLSGLRDISQKKMCLKWHLSPCICIEIT